MLQSLDAWLLAPFERLIAALRDPRHGNRVALAAAFAYVVLWLVYAIVSRSTFDINADMAEQVVWARHLDWGYPKHPPLLAWLLAAWFAVFPATDWAYNLLAALNLGLGLYLAYVLAGEWLEGDKRIAAPFLLAVIPFYNFLGLKFDQNSALIPLWAITALAFTRALETRRIGWAIVMGVGGAAAMSVKYWSAFFLLALIVAALFDKRRDAYFRSAAPYVTVAVAALLLLPHAVWLVQNNFPPAHWVTARRASSDVADWLRSLSEYSFGTLGYISVALIAYAVVTRPSRAALRDTLLPADNLRRRAALLFWVPLLLPVAVAMATRTSLLSLWNVPAFNLLPVMLLSSPRVTLVRKGAARIAALATYFAIAAVLASPIAAYVFLKAGQENDAIYAHLLMDQMQRDWHAKTDRPLKFVAGPFGLISTAAFYGADRPLAYADFSPYLSPWATPEKLAATASPSVVRPKTVPASTR